MSVLELHALDYDLSVITHGDRFRCGIRRGALLESPLPRSWERTSPKVVGAAGRSEDPAVFDVCNVAHPESRSTLITKPVTRNLEIDIEERFIASVAFIKVTEVTEIMEIIFSFSHPLILESSARVLQAVAQLAW